MLSHTNICHRCTLAATRWAFCSAKAEFILRPTVVARRRYGWIACVVPWRKVRRISAVHRISLIFLNLFYVFFFVLFFFFCPLLYQHLCAVILLINVSSGGNECSFICMRRNKILKTTLFSYKVVVWWLFWFSQLWRWETCFDVDWF